MRGNGDFRSLSGAWGRGEEQRADESEHALVRMWESNEVAVNRSNEWILIIP